MNLKRYEEIASEEAIKRIINKEEVFDENERRFFSLGKSNTVWIQTEQPYGSVNSSSEHTLEDLLDKKWFIKKPFDVRAEMLARPNEWVGAFKNSFEDWVKVGFSTETMSPRQTNAELESGFSREETVLSMPEEFDRCIPIEDVPKEDFA